MTSFRVSRRMTTFTFVSGASSVTLVGKKKGRHEPPRKVKLMLDGDQYNECGEVWQHNI